MIRPDPSARALVVAASLLAACTPTPPPSVTGSPPAASSSAPLAAPAAPPSSAVTAAASAPSPALPACPRLPEPRASAGAESAPAAATAACARLAAAAEKKARAADKEAPGWLSSHWPGVGKCVEDKAGAWALELTSFKTDKERQRSGRYQLVRVDAKGGLVRTNLQENFGELSEGERQGAALRASVDVDADGVPEAFLEQSGYHGGGEDAWTHRTLYRLQGREAVKVPLPLSDKRPGSILEIADLDSDGRPDLIVESPFRLDVPCTLDGEAAGPRLLLHNTPKGFVLDDALTHDFARSECARASTARLVSVAAEGADPRDFAARTALAIGCARLGGATPEALKAQLTRELAGQQPGQGCTVALNSALGAAEVKPPLQVTALACRP